MVEVFAGISDENNPSREAGWHVFCNGRLILDADKTYRTGWGDKDDVDYQCFTLNTTDFALRLLRF